MDKFSNENDRDKSVIHSVIKAAQILKLFTKEEPMMTLSDITKKIPYTKTTVMRYCNTLEHLNFIEKIYIGNTPYYRLGMELFVIGSRALHAIDLPERAKPYLKKLADETGENAYLFIERNSRAYCIQKQTGNNVIQTVTTHVGDSLPLNVGGGPVAIFVSMDSMRKKEILQDLQLNDIELQKLLEKVDFFKINNYVISKNETYEGTAAIGTPIYNHENIPIGSISIGGLESRFSNDRLPSLEKLLKESAHNLSSAIGWKGV